jgi:hypothetical protein
MYVSVCVVPDLPNRAVIVTRDMDRVTVLVHPAPDMAALSYVMQYALTSSESAAAWCELETRGVGHDLDLVAR